MARIFSIFGHSYQEKLAQWHTKFVKVGARYSQIVNKPYKIVQNFEDFAKMGKFRQIWSHWDRFLSTSVRV